MVLRATLFLAFLASVLRATPLPAATASEFASAIAQRPCTACSESTGGDGTGLVGLLLFNAAAEAELGPKAFVSAEVGASLFESVAAGATETYSFEFVGPSGSIPVDIRLLMGVDHSPGFASPAAIADATFGVLISGLQLLGMDVQCRIDVCDHTSFNGVLTHTFFANQIYTVQADVDVQAVAGDQSAGLVDPMIYIDPGFANAGQYTLLLSDGVGNLGPDSGVPEPGTAVFAILGGALILIRKIRISGAAVPGHTGDRDERRGPNRL